MAVTISPGLRAPANTAQFSPELGTSGRILSKLGLNRQEQAALLDVSVRRLQRAARGPGPLLSQDQFTRLRLLIEILQNLAMLYGDGAKRGWLHCPNQFAPFGNLCPFEYMRRFGILGMIDTRDALNAARCGRPVDWPIAIQDLQHIAVLPHPADLDEILPSIQRSDERVGWRRKSTQQDSVIKDLL